MIELFFNSFADRLAETVTVIWLLILAFVWVSTHDDDDDQTPKHP
jgi:hypothetical protein